MNTPETAQHIRELDARIAALETQVASQQALLHETIGTIGGAVIGLQDHTAALQRDKADWIDFGEAVLRDLDALRKAIAGTSSFLLPEGSMPLHPFLRTNLPLVAKNQVKTTLAALGYLRRSPGPNRTVYTPTRKGRKYFVTAPYPACPSYPELHVTAEGIAELNRLYAAGKLVLKQAATTTGTAA